MATRVSKAPQSGVVGGIDPAGESMVAELLRKLGTRSARPGEFLEHPELYEFHGREPEA